MIYTVAAGLASLLSFVAFGLITAWYVVPWLRAQDRADALIALLWVHAFRHIALQIYSAQKFGFAVSDGARDQVAIGDTVGMILAVAAIIALRYRVRGSVLLTWALAAETLYDLASSTIAGIGEEFFEKAAGVTWMILTFYVPVLWVSLGLVVWQLFARRHEPLSPARA
jgi:hypothetical protein